MLLLGSGLLAVVKQGHFLSPAGISFDGLRGCHPRPGPGVPSVRPSVLRGQPLTPVGPTLGRKANSGRVVISVISFRNLV